MRIIATSIQNTPHISTNQRIFTEAKYMQNTFTLSDYQGFVGYLHTASVL